MKRLLPKYVTEFRDRHGKMRCRFRRTGFASYYFKAAFGTTAFLQEYRACLDGDAAPPVSPGADRIAPGTFHDLISRYYRSPEWLGITKDSTRAVYRGVIERFRAEHGDKMVVDLRAPHVSAILAKKAGTPTAANILRKVLARLMRFAVAQEMRRDNPVHATVPYKVKTDGYHTWSEDELEQFQERHPLGTKAHLALALMLYTGQRRGDAIRMGRQHIDKDGRIRVTQEKTGTPLRLRVHPKLAEAILAVPRDHLTFLTTAYGRPFTSAGFGNWFRDRCNEAGLVHCSAHGLRKAAARRLAEAGCSNQVIKAVTGHKGDAEVALYTAAADQIALADRAMDALSKWEMANLATELDTTADKAL